MTKEQIEAHIKVLNDYELSLLRNHWDDPDMVTDEILKVIVDRDRLRTALAIPDKS